MRLVSLLDPAPRLAGAVGLALLALGGCHLVFPFDSEAADAAVELGPADGAAEVAHDAAVDAAADVAAVEAGEDDGPPADLTLVDAGPAEAQVVDLSLVEAGADACWPGPPPPATTLCVDGDGAATNGCNACPPPHDPDCDGLAGPTLPRDPWPWDRNPLLFSDGFSAGLGLWSVSGASSSAGSGKVTFPKLATMTLSSASCVAALPDPNYLTEVKLKVTSHGAGDRIFQLLTALAAPVHRMCRISGSDSAITLKVEERTSTTSAVSDTDTYSGGGIKTGTELILQSWGEGSGATHTHHCRLLSGDGKTKLVHVSKTQALTAAGTVMLGCDSADYELDYVRIYKQ